MYKKDFLNFYIFLEQYDDLNFLIAMLKFNTAPTRAKLKLGTMVNLTDSKRKLKMLWKANRQYFSEILNLDFVELRENEKSVLVYFYDKKRLKNKLKEDKITKFLKDFEYSKCGNYKDYLEHLKNRFLENDSCPNEIGIFLGYPLRDVYNFHCKNCKCKLTGYWKCYTNVDSSKRAFERYDREKLKTIEKIYLENAI
ncbi:DUF3793 family protein [Peptoniphilus mikwangii]|uniref:DUF3793 family protein n=1 Tax=Peptoniphilus mikwangii TaxID=1354300 RepID=UPI0003F6CAB1|nr:DUF3793 family protein [Peptoniphilus mikwangii]